MRLYDTDGTLICDTWAADDCNAELDWQPFGYAGCNRPHVPPTHLRGSSSEPDFTPQHSDPHGRRGGSRAQHLRQLRGTHQPAFRSGRQPLTSSLFLLLHAPYRYMC